MNTTLDGLEGYFSFVTPLELTTDAGSRSDVLGAGDAGAVRSARAHAGARPHLRQRRTAGPRSSSATATGSAASAAIPRSSARPCSSPTLPVAVVGVMPPDFVFPYGGMLGPGGFTRVTRVDVWVPIAFSGPVARANRMLTESGDLVRNVHWWGAIGRLKPGVTPERRPQAESARPSPAQLEQTVPRQQQGLGRDRRSDARSDRRHHPAGAAHPDGRHRVRAADGVGQRRQPAARARHCSASASWRRGRRWERRARGWSASCSPKASSSPLAGGLAGLARDVGRGPRVGRGGAGAPAAHRRGDASTGASSLVTGIVTMLTGVLVGFAPALSSTSVNPQAALQDNSRGTVGGAARRRIRSALVVAEVALAVALTTGAGLLLRSFVSLRERQPGLRDRASAHLADEHPRPAAVARRSARVLSRLLRTDGSTARRAGGRGNDAHSAREHQRLDDRPGGRPCSARSPSFRKCSSGGPCTTTSPPWASRSCVAAGSPLEDGPTAPAVAVINETMARRMFPGEEPVGQRVRIGPSPTGPWTTIVGVIGDVRHGGLEETPQPGALHHLAAEPARRAVHRAAGHGRSGGDR